VPHPERGHYIQVASPIRLSDNDVPVDRSPLLGEHTEEILASVGYDADAIAAMRTAGAI
jgi:formyl-CoA transferase